MEKHRAIPPGYMTVGEVAKKMNTTVRTLQYYDREGVLSPSAESEGGRRLYTDKDIIKLHQIQSMKYLGFSLDDIKNRLITLDTPTDVAELLTEHATVVREKIATLSEALSAIETLKEEVLAMQTVNFHKYADIIVNLQMKNASYGFIKHLDDNTLDTLRNRFHGDADRAAATIQSLNRLMNKAIRFQEKKIQPDSEEGLALAKEYWDKILELTGGNPALISELTSLYENVDDSDKWKEKFGKALRFIEPALAAYFTKLGINPFDQRDAGPNGG